MRWSKADNISLQLFLVLTCLLFPKAIAESGLNCGGTVKTFGDKTFPSLQNFFGNYTKCTWTLKVPRGQRIKATFDFNSLVSIFTRVTWIVEFLPWYN